ncbi:hypothetical protein BV22DRAFT_50823 [Leucogyrophana mollusca]|uniref:Uncharacterized protein n=1 Tax=Leucogyrophana mollusca TaxID=85980 RepID=A0ACB8BZ87_9AGAM|nr:hypothetical protein BV22DRAFT_50823 [Leucogyrophana mollusca]
MCRSHMTTLQDCCKESREWMQRHARSTATHLNDPHSGRRPPVTLVLTRPGPKFGQGHQGPSQFRLSKWHPRQISIIFVASANIPSETLGEMEARVPTLFSHWYLIDSKEFTFV